MTKCSLRGVTATASVAGGAATEPAAAPAAGRAVGVATQHSCGSSFGWNGKCCVRARNGTSCSDNTMCAVGAVTELLPAVAAIASAVLGVATEPAAAEAAGAVLEAVTDPVRPTSVFFNPVGDDKKTLLGTGGSDQ